MARWRRFCARLAIGRGAELSAVDAALTAAMTGHGAGAMITGEPGIQKLALVLEMAVRAASRGIQVVRGLAVPQSATAAYRPWSDALMQLLRDLLFPADVAMEPGRPALDALLPSMAGPAPARGEVSPGVRGEVLIELLRRGSRPKAWSSCCGTSPTGPTRTRWP